MSTLRTFFPPVTPVTPATQPFMQVQDQKPTGTNGGASVAGDNHRALNTVLHNDIVGASLASNQVTLPAGTYYAEADCNITRDTLVASRGLLRITVDGVPVLIGTNTAANTAYDCIPVAVSGQFSLTVSSVIAVIMWSASAAVDGFGYPASQPPYEVFTDFRIWKISD